MSSCMQALGTHFHTTRTRDLYHCKVVHIHNEGGGADKLIPGGTFRVPGLQKCCL